ncbi:hypothetical protein EFY79_00575 [Hanamia caeni]|uniref:Uncharacterized protein n=1 Tax=Hanamia caeni TaxID=2294116 RepID=A0A3M9NPV2_9BACT|nr:hypothetical protein [Hanamia caeni]RNI39831.1 hypothetical protein EFY79_00575 [Hanamia caeni]
MNGFINHILKRHLNPNNNIEPRTTGRFEQINQENQSSHETNFIEQIDEIITPKNQIRSKEENAFENFESLNQVNPAPNMEMTNVDYNEPFLEIKPTINNNTNSHLDGYYEGQSFQERNALNLNEHNVETNNFENSRKTEREPELKKKDFASGHKDVFNVTNTAFYQDNYTLQKNLSVNNVNFKDKANENELPVIKVSIGRIDVRAIVSSQPEKKINTAHQKPPMSLEDYLKKRNSDK